MFKNYLKIALKVLLRRKMFTFISLFGIFFTLTILLAATAVYTSLVVTNPVEKNLSRTLFLSHVEVWFTKSSCMINPANTYMIEAGVKTLAHTEVVSFCSYHFAALSTYLKNERVDIDTKETDENYFKVISLKFIEGHPYSRKDIESGQKVVVICRSLSKRYFGDQSALGKSITLENQTYRIIGVAKDVPKLYFRAYAQLWKPYNYANYMTEVQHKTFWNPNYLVMIVAKNKSDFKAINSQFAQHITKLKPKDFDSLKAKLDSSFDLIFGSFIYSDPFMGTQEKAKRIITVVFIMLMFLTIPLLNLMNLTISRIFERSSEIGVRKAFGATKRQMTVQFIYENIVITLLGGIFGFAGAWLLLKGINAGGMAEIGSVTFSFTIFAYGLLVIVVFGIVSGLYPALKMAKLHIVDTLKGGNK